MTDEKKFAAGKKARPFHWILLAVYPPLLLYSLNAPAFDPEVVVAPVLTIVAVAAVLWTAAALLLKNGRKAALLVSLLLIAVFSYGHARHLVGNPHWYIGGMHIGHNKLLLPIYLLVLLAGSWWIVRTRRRLGKITRVMNFVAAALVFVASAQAIYLRVAAGGGTDVSYPAPESSARPLVRPDIYYIILDGYGRSDILEEMYGHDNARLRTHLERKGFTVADESVANYPQTALSLASSLNMDYLDALADSVGRDTADRGPARRLVADSAVTRFLKQRGYHTVAFATGAEVTPRRGIDHWMSPGMDLGEFGEAILDMTPLPVVSTSLRRYDVHRDRIDFAFSELPAVAELDGPLFVMAHIMCPHPPFVFDAEGNHLTPPRRFTVDDASHFMELKGASRNEYLKGYAEQLAYVDLRLGAAVDAILKRSTRPTVIIIQGDHGPGLNLDWDSLKNSMDVTPSGVQERFGIFNAVRLTGIKGKALPEIPADLTPVNTFRIVLNHCFETNLPLLDNRALFSTVDRPYDFKDVTAHVASPKPAPQPHPTSRPTTSSAPATSTAPAGP